MDRLTKSYFVLIMGLGLTLIAYYLGFSMLVYLVFPLVLIAEISFVLLTYIQESVSPVDEILLRSSGWSLDPEMESLELGGNQVYYLRGEATIYGELKGGAVKVLTYWDGSGDLWKNEEVSEEIIVEILDTHTHSLTHTLTQARAPSPSEPLEPESPDTHTHSLTQAQVPESPDSGSQFNDDRTKCKNKEEKEKEKERANKKGSGFVKWLEDLRARNIEKLERNYSPAERRLIEDYRKKKDIKKSWRDS